ncbi:protein disulfide-isomerase 5-2-like [Cucurbita maxima]|uniref:Protein disulfide-isomerase 5-2-like n=1 Tax=Cucurbita maxima TaxID=3661 RepID=A0A6J1K269_CUCMA|nr:protein disulfide-isomerase 5-2-like [Cucurbita maxima]
MMIVKLSTVKMQRSWQVLVLVLLSLLSLPSSSFSSAELPPTADGKVLELDESNFDLAISSFSYILVDFYAPWCGHCKRLSPELDAAAPQLAKLKEPVVLAKVNADKFTGLAKKYDVDAYPTIKIFMHGIPADYYGPRKAELIVRYLKKFVAPDVSILESDSSINEFVEAAGPYFPIYLGFGLDESVISKFAINYKKKAWFSVAKGFSEDIMVSYDFDKVPALVSIHPSYNNERSIFYGPFEEQFLEEFIKQSMLPLVLPINYDTLKLLKDDERKIALTIVEDEDDDQTKNLITLLKAAASANRELVFAYVGSKQWGEFTDSFGDKKTTLPKMVIWDGKDDYLMVTGSESIIGNDYASEISKFIEGYREGRTEERRVAGPAIIGFISSLMGIRSVYIIVIIVAGIMLYRTKDDNNEYRRVDTPARDQVDQTSSSSSHVERTEYRASDKED